VAGLGTAGGRAGTEKGGRAAAAGGDGRRVRRESLAKDVELVREMPERVYDGQMQ